MLVIRPDAPDDSVQALIDRQTRTIVTAGGQIIKVSPWGRRRLAYKIGPHHEASYFIIVFDAPSEAVAELERGLNITEEVLRHLVTRVDRPTASRRPSAGGEEDEIVVDVDGLGPPPDEDFVDLESEFIDESESEAAPAATDR
jgi:small subunit ribosomal protein S6